MIRFIQGLLITAFLVFSVIGLLYFSDLAILSPLRKLSVYENSIEPWINKQLSSGSVSTDYVGEVQSYNGDATSRTQAELVPLPIRKSGQKIINKSLISTGNQSGVKIQLDDDSVVEVGANTVVYINIEKDPNKDNAVEYSLRLLSGGILAKKGAGSKSSLVVRSRRGDVQKIEGTQSKGFIIKPNQSLLGETGASATGAESDLVAVDQAQNAESLQAMQDKAEAEELARQKSIADQKARKSMEEDIANFKVDIPELPGFSDAEIAKEIAKTEREKQKNKEKSLVLNMKKSSREDFSDDYLILRALTEQKKGNGIKAQQLAALSLTSKGYYNAVRFNEATEIALEILIQGYYDKKGCVQATELLKNIGKQFSKDKRAKSWNQKWALKVRKRCRLPKGKTGIG